MWYNDYVGIPFLAKGREKTGVDCWGLAILVYSEQFNITLPSFSDNYDFEDTDRIAELTAQYKEAWEETTEPKPGSIVLFKVLGQVSHVGIYVGNNKFLHCRENHSSAIESLDSISWNKRLAGFFNYAEKSSAVLNVVPHPLRTERWTVPVPNGTTVAQLSEWVLEKFEISKELESSVTIIRNGVVVPKSEYQTTIILDSDTIEYRSVPGKSLFRLILVIAVAYVAIQFGGPLGAALLPTGTSAATAAAVGTAVISTVGNLLIGYLMPIRPPTVKDPGTAESQLLLSGGGNSVNKYAAIPIVLGRVRMTPVLGGESYVDSNTDNSYLNMLMVWGFGPLDIDKTTLRIGLNSLSQYENGAGIPVEHYSLNDAYTPDEAADLLNFNTLYGSDRQQVYSGITLVMHTTPTNVNVDGNDGFGAVGPWTTVALSQTNTSKIDVNLHFPQGLRQLRVSGKKAGDIYDLEAKFQVQIRACDKFGTELGSWGDMLKAAYPATTVIANRAFNSSNVAKYQWTRIGVGVSGIQIKTGPLCDAANSTYGVDGAGFGGTAFGAFGVIPALYKENAGVRLPSWPAGVYPLVDVCMYGETLYSTDSSVKSTLLTGFGITTVDIASVNYNTASWTNPTAGANTGDKLVSIAAGTCTRSTNTVVSLGTDASGLFKQRKDAFSYTISTAVALLPDDGFYKVRVRRLTDDSIDTPDLKNKNMCVIVFQTATATATNKPIREGSSNWRLAKTAIRIKANDQLNSRVEGINAIVTTICKDWDSTTSKWVQRKTNNPASLFLYILEHPANAYRIAPADVTTKINMTALKDWHVFCTTNGYTFNSVVGSQRSVLEILKDICAAGRASPAMVDGKWTVIIDTAKPDIIQHFTPHNSWGFESTKRLPKQPHALRVSYINADSDYQEDEALIYNAGYAAVADTVNNIKAAEIFEQISLPGITDYATITKHARWHLAQATLRPEVFSLNTDLEYLVCNRGDRVKVMHDVPLWGTGSGRIKNKITNVIPTGITKVSTTATATHSTQLYPLYTVGSTITIAGSSIAGYNGDKVVTACDNSSVSWTDATTGTATFSNISRTTTAITVTNRIATATFATPGYVPYAIGDTITITGVIPTNYNGTKTVTGCTTTTVSWTEATLSAATIYGSIVGTSSITTLTPSVFQLDEEMPLVSGTSYTIRVRTKLGGSTTKTVAAVSTSGYYDTIKLSTTSTAAEIDTNDLFMFGELSKESVDLLVLSIEPFGNQNAKITLVDYAETLFTTDYATTNFTVPTYVNNITLPSKNLVQSIIYKPIITSVISDETVMEQVSPGAFKYNIKVGFTNPPNLPTSITHVIAEIDAEGDNVDNWMSSLPIQVGAQSLTIGNVDELKTYKIRLRYISQDGRTGPWQSAIAAPIESTNVSSGVLTINTVARHSYSVGTPVYLYNNNSGNNTLNNIYIVDSIPTKTSLICRITQPTTTITSTATYATAGYAVATYPEKNYAPYTVGEQILVAGSSVSGSTIYNGNATVTDCDSTSVSWANGNLLTFTEDFRNTVEAGSTRPWVQNPEVDAGVTYETAVPNSLGVNGVSKLQCTSTVTNARQIYQPIITLANDTIITTSVEAKAAELSIIQVAIRTKVPDYPYVDFNLATGTIATLGPSASSSILKYGIDNLGNGWYRCWFTASVVVGTTQPVVFLQIPSVVGVVGQGVYITRAQVNLGSYPSKYVPVLTATPNVLPAAATTQGTITPCVTTTSIAQSTGISTATFAAQKYLSFAPGSSINITDAVPSGFTGTYTVTDSTPTTVSWAQNLATFPNDFDNAVWTKTNTTITANTIVAPDGTLTADKIVETATSAQHLIYRTITSTSATPYTYTVYAKAAEWTNFILQMGAGGPYASFDLNTGLATTALGATSATMTDVGNGWFKCTVGARSNSSSFYYVFKTSSIYSGTAGTGMYIWGAQLTPSVMPNLLTFPNDFNNAAWIKTSTTVGIGVDLIAAPDSTVTANKLTATNTVTSYVRQSTTTNKNTNYTVSLYVKAGTSTGSHLRIYDGSITTQIAGIGIVWSGVTGTLGTVNGTWVVTPTLSAVGNNWYHITGTVSSGAYTSIAVLFYPDNTNGPNYSYAWGARIADYSNSATTQGTIVRTPNVGSWSTSVSLQSNQDLTTGQGLVSSKFNNSNKYLAENLSHKVIGKTSPPDTVTGLSVIEDYNLGKLNLSWSANAELDVQFYEVRTNENWGTEAGRIYLGGSKSTSTSPGALGVATTYYIKAIDYSGNYSVAAASISYTLAIPTATVTTVATPIYNSTSLTDTTVTLNWTAVTGTKFAIDQYKITLTRPTPSVIVTTHYIKGTTWTIPANWVGNATVAFNAIDILGSTSATSSNFTITKTEPGTVSGITKAVVGTGILVSWTELAPSTNGVPILGYEIRTSDANWGSTSATNLIYSGSTSNTNIDLKVIAPAVVFSTGTKTFYIKAYDVDGKYSTTAASFTHVIAAPANTTWTSTPVVFADTNLTAATITLNWNAATPPHGLYAYELTYTTTSGTLVTKVVNTTTITLNTSAVWTIANSAVPVTFTVKVIDNLDITNKSTGVQQTVTKSAPAAASNFIAKVIDNNVLLSWTPPLKTTLPIDHFTILKGDAFVTAANIGDKTGTFTIVFEQTGGNFTYWITTVDTDNWTSSPVSLTATVASPPDYVFNAAYSSIFAAINTTVTNTIASNANITVGSTENMYVGMQIILGGTAFGGLSAGYYYIAAIINNTTITISTSSSLLPVFIASSNASGTMTLIDATGAIGINTNSIYDNNGIIMPVDTAATWTTHFASGTGRTWAGPSEQITYFPNYIQPAKSAGFYEEVYNYGKTLASSQITLSYTGISTNAPLINTTISTAASTTPSGPVVTNAANSTTVTSASVGTNGLLVGNFITIPATTSGQTVRIVSAGIGTMQVYPPVVLANTSVSYSYAGTWTNYPGTTALGTAFQYVKAKINTTQSTLTTGLSTISATGAAGPSLDLNFVASTTLDPRITFTRASIGTYVDSTGIIRTVTADVPRLDYDPVTRQPLGLLIEEARTNLILQSQDLSAAAWAGTTKTASTSTFLGIPFWKVAKATTSTSESMSQIFAPTTIVGNTYTATVALQASTSTTVQIGLYGTSSLWGLDADSSATIVSGPGTLVRSSGSLFTITSLSTTTPTLIRVTKTYQAIESAGFYLYPGTSTSSTLGDSVLATRIQVELGAFATSYIPTTTTTVLRAADNASMSGTNFSSWYTGTTEGTMYVEGTMGPDNIAVNKAPFELGDTLGAGAARLIVRQLSSGFTDILAVSGSVVQANITSVATVSAGSPYKVATTFKLNDYGLSLNGATAVTTASGTLPTFTKLFIGQNYTFTGQPNSHIRRLTYFPRRVVNADLALLSNTGQITVTGVTGTNFTKIFKAGDTITIPATLGIDYNITSVTNDTTLGIMVPVGVTMPTASGANFAYKGKDLYKLTSMDVKLDAKQKTESGMVVADSVPSTGSIVNFTIPFIDVSSITLSANGTAVSPPTCIYNFSDNNTTGTYNVPGTTTCTITTSTGHGLVANTQNAYVTFTSGTAISGIYPITYISATSFSILLTAALTTSGTVSVYPNSMTVYALTSAGGRFTPNPTVSYTVRGF